MKKNKMEKLINKVKKTRFRLLPQNNKRARTKWNDKHKQYIRWTTYIWRVIRT